MFRKGGNVTFIVEELKAVFNRLRPPLQVWRHMPSIVVEIGAVIEQHMKNIGMLHDSEMDEATRKLIAEKHAAYEQAGAKKI